MLDKKLFAFRLKSLRLDKAAKLNRKLTQAEVADSASVSRGHLAGAETGHTGISLESAVSLAKYYNVSLDYLAGLSPSPVKMSERIAHDEKEEILLKMWRLLTDEERLGIMALIRRNSNSTAA